MIQSLLQRVLGLERYLFAFSRFKIRTLHRDRNERDVLHFIDQMPTDAVVLDIGANVGIMTVLIARRVSRGHVHAFEPIPENFRVLQRIVRHFGLTNVTLHEMALGDSDHELEMVMPVEQSVRMQGLSRVVTGQPGDPTEGEHYSVPQRRLDDLEELRRVHVAGMKVDVEDFEQYVFRGGLGLIQRCQPLVYTELGRSGNRRACLDLFDQLGYSVGVLEDGEVVPFDPGRHEQHNFFLTPARTGR